MSLTTRHQGLIIAESAIAEALSSREPVLIDLTPRITTAGWDTATAQILIPDPALDAEGALAQFPQGTRIDPEKNWWVTAAKPTSKLPGLWFLELALKGWTGNKPCKINWGAAAQQQSAENVNAPPPSGTGTEFYPKFQGHEAGNTFTLTYPVLDVLATTAGGDPIVPSHLVGRSRDDSPDWTDPNNPSFTIGPQTVGESMWTSIADAVYHWPNGWVLADLQADILPGTHVGMITETYNHIRPFTP